MRALSMFGRIAVGAAVAVCAACSGAATRAEQKPAEGLRPAEAAPRCAIDGAPVVVRSDGAAVLERWDLDARDVWATPVLPADAGYAAFRAAIRDAGGDLLHPIADPAELRDDAGRELWRREERNREIAYAGRAGTLRPIHCLEAWAFARQHARHSELTTPTEFLLAVLERREGDRRRVRLYFTGGDQLFPPKSVYPFPDIEADVAQGFHFAVLLHNHTVRRRGDRPALGVPAPSTSDVELLRHLAADLGLRAAWVTNGFYTLEIPASALEQYLTRE